MSASTPVPPNGPAATKVSQDRADDKNHPPLPAFHSVHDYSRGGDEGSDLVASGATGRQRESRSADHDGHHLSGRLSLTSSVRSEESKSKDKGKENDAVPYQVKRNSGGFLLESITNQKRLSQSSWTTPDGDFRRKRESAGSDLSVSKRRQRNNANSNSSFRSSPLASEFKRDPIVHDHSNSDTLIPGTDIRRSLSSTQGGPNRNGRAASSSSNADSQKPAVANVGYDQDPAQIVQMALSLSEGRRRLASGRRYVSMEQGERRVISTASTVGSRNSVRGKSIAPFLATNRQASRTGSPKATQPNGQHDADSPELDEDLYYDMDFLEQISPATAARVEKAKIYFEIAHEHRRLLSHLPPIRKPGRPASSTGPEAMQKAYNPLQYVRNRKLRIWEKTPFDSEADGWHDVEKVRTWVDAVVSSHPETQHDELECVRLPPLDQKTAKSDDEGREDALNEPQSAISPRIPDPYHSKPTRPRSDWVTHPADLIADAYWLEQGMNKTKIQDRDNSLIYPPDTHFKFSGWRNRNPMDMPSDLQQPSPAPELDTVTSDEAPPSALPELPTFKSAHNSHKFARRRSKFKDSRQTKESSGSRERSRIRRKLFHDSESDDSASSSSDGDAMDRGRRRLRRKRLQSPGDEGQKARVSSSPSKHSPQVGDSSQGSSAVNSKRSSVDHSALAKILKIDTLKKASPLSRSRNREGSSRPTSMRVPLRSSLEQERPPRASSDYDTTTVQNSPTGPQWPSIAINLSPPPSRAPSPARKPISTILGPFQRKHDNEESERISATDFAHAPSAQPNRLANEVKDQLDSSRSRGTSPMTRGMRPSSKNHTESTQPDDLVLQHSDENNYNAASKVTTRSAGTNGSDHSKLRGIFKGGRIAELVGNEVSRVGDFIWKREAPSLYKHRPSASETSLRSYPGSDSDRETDVNGTVLTTPPPMHPPTRSSTISSTKSERLSPTIPRLSPPSNAPPRYNNPNLPSFTSPFQRDRDEQERKQGLLSTDDGRIRSDSTDHISRLAAHHRSSSHSPRLDRLALPKLDTGRSSNDLDRHQSYGFGAALDLTRSRDASELLNTAIGSATGLKGIHGSRSAGDLTHAAGSEATEEETDAEGVSWRDIGRAEALLLSSTVKAREIGRRAEEEKSDLPKFFVDTLTPEDRALHTAQPMRVKKRELYIMAARNIMKNLDDYSSTFNDKLNNYSSSVAPGQHMQLQALEDLIENTMTPQVRTTADRVGQLSMKLTTTSTLAVKGLNDTIEVAFRRRRRGPIRLLRKVWFAGIEWTVVGLLWLIWAVVSIIQLVLGSIRVTLGMVKWLLWIN
ncbi:hypothetical protein LTR99_002374 [Exophiala xenobiotica]|nr:hypothetical protein LTR99_002374 [Exophiala xenobiotica]